MPGPPESGGDEPPPAGTASRSDSRGHRLTSFTQAGLSAITQNAKAPSKLFDLFNQIARLRSADFCSARSDRVSFRFKDS
jgi:hypothetical protein